MSYLKIITLKIFCKIIFYMLTPVSSGILLSIMVLLQLLQFTVIMKQQY